MFRRLFVPILMVCAAASAAAQGTQITFGGLQQDTSLPVEVQADSLRLNQADNSAVFSGNVLVGQGDLRLSAAEVRVEYAAEGGAIERLLASGGVTMATPEEAAEAQQADYAVAAGTVVLTGDVLLTQGPNAVSGQRLTVDLKAGTGVMEGRVTTIFTPQGKPGATPAP